MGLALSFPFLCGSLDYAAGHPSPLFPSPLPLPFAYKGALSGLSGSYCASVCKINVAGEQFVQEDPGSSLSQVPRAWPPPPGGRPSLWLCPCILGSGVLRSCLLPCWAVGDSPALILLRVVLSVEDRLLLKIKVPKALLR